MRRIDAAPDQTQILLGGWSLRKKFSDMGSHRQRITSLLFVLIFFLLHCWIVINFAVLSKDLIWGDSSAAHLIPAPLYSVMRVPDSQSAVERNAVNRLAADFAQVYFPASDPTAVIKAYTSDTPDPWGRPSRYAPLVQAVLSASLARLPYGWASFLHLTIQLLIFQITYICAFKAFGIAHDIPVGLLLANVCLFLTPAGLAQFERGQFSLYIAASYLWLFIGLHERKTLYVVLAALLGYVKWTSFPFTFVALALWAIDLGRIQKLTPHIRLIFAYMITVACCFVVFLTPGIHFVRGLLDQEASYEAGGISLAQVAPRLLVKLSPLVCVTAGAWYVIRRALDFRHLIPLLAGVGVFLLTYPTLAFEYAVSTLLCFIPLIMYWARTVDVTSSGATIRNSFYVFIIAASFSFFMPEHTLRIMCIYLVCSVGLMLVPLLRSTSVVPVALTETQTSV